MSQPLVANHRQWRVTLNFVFGSLSSPGSSVLHTLLYTFTIIPYIITEAFEAPSSMAFPLSDMFS